MGRARSVRGTLLGAWVGVLMLGAPTAMAANVVPPQVDRSGRTLASGTGEWFPPPSGYLYAWYRCTGVLTTSCSPVAGANASTYVLRTADIGYRIRSRVSDSSGGDPTFSNAEGPITAAPPMNTVAPSVTGRARAELALSVTSGSWSGRLAGDPGFTYQWQRCTSAAAASCANVAGARSTVYFVGNPDVGRWIRVVVGAEGLGLSTATAPAKPLGPVQSAAPGVSEPTLKRLSPFPVLVIAGRLRGSITQISDFVVRGPRRARVTVRCKGKRCPFGRIGGQIGRRKRLRFRRAQRRFRAGQVLEIRVTGRNRVGKFTRVRFRRGRAPRRSDSCLRPGTTRPSPCGET